MNVTNEELMQIRDQIKYLSGGGKAVAPERRLNGIYGSMTLEGLEDIVAVRDTKLRFEGFGVQEDLTGVTVIDVGSNVGAMALEFARRGATVTGVEFRQDRVDLCNRIAHGWELEAVFHQADFNSVDPEAAWLTTKYDLVLCSAVDNYIDDRATFYRMLRRLTGGEMLYECNVRRGGATIVEATEWLTAAGFTSVNYLGVGQDQFLRRKIYRVS